MQRIGVFIVISILMLGSIWAENTLTVGNGIKDEGRVVLHLNLSEPIAGLQVRLVPEVAGVRLQEVQLLQALHERFDRVGFETQADGEAVVLAFRGQATLPLPESGGAVMELIYDVDASVRSGTIGLDVEDLLVVDPQGRQIPVIGIGGRLFDRQVATFREVSIAAGFEQLFYTPGTGSRGGAWADYDNDGDDDLLYAGFHSTLLRNNGDGTFDDVGETSGARQVLVGLGDFGGANSVAWADYDNDGHADAFALTQFGQRALLKNKGDGTFENATAIAGVAVVSEGGYSANWIDFNRDGYLDLYTSDGLLFQNQGDGTFIDVSEATGIGRSPFSGTAWADYDGDGDSDLITVDRHYRNDGGIFIDVTDTTGIAPGSAFGGGITWGDFDNDGVLDLYMARRGGMTSNLYQNRGDGTFIDVTDQTGVGVAEAQSTAWLDTDNDGDLDLFVSRPQETTPYALFRNNRNGTFDEIGVPAGLLWDTQGPGSEPGSGVATTDFNGDGRTDLFVANEMPLGFLFENLGNGVANHTLILKLEGRKSNRMAVGAQVTVRANGKVQTRHVGGGSNRSQQGQTLIFGLGNTSVADRVTVLWPSGRHESVFMVPADRLLTVVEGNLTSVGSATTQEDFNADGRVDFVDFLAFAQVFGSSQSENWDAKFDLDRDGVIGFGDFLRFAVAFGT